MIKFKQALADPGGGGGWLARGTCAVPHPSTEILSISLRFAEN